MLRCRPSMSSVAGFALFAAGAGLLPPAGISAAVDTGPGERLAALIAALGDDDYHRREAAAAELSALGPTAIDALLAAAETSGDLEVALRARWLVEAIPFEMPHDPPEVVKLLDRFKRREFAERVQAMHRLLRVDDDAGRDAALTAAGAALADLRTATAEDAPRGGHHGTPDTGGAAGQTRRIFERCHVRMLLAAGRRDAAATTVAAMIGEALAAEGDDRDTTAECVDALAWAVDAGLPDAVDAVLAVPQIATDRPLVGLAVACAERARGRETEAEERFMAALAAGGEEGFVERLQAAILLAKWGCTEWATHAYDTLLEASDLPAAELTLAATMYAEFLHDLERDEQAAGCLQRIFAREEAAPGRRDRGPPLEAIGRDPRATRSRMHFFESCVLGRKGNAPGCRHALEQALAVYPKDVDALIALYALPDNTPEQKADVVRRIKAALAQLEDEIQAVPDDANGYNEYAWLVANTEGDVEKATRYSKLSLVKSFDNPSYLDTLAHCHAAAGRTRAAVRTQRLAQRQEPHNHTIARNLARFEKLAP